MINEVTITDGEYEGRRGIVLVRHRDDRVNEYGEYTVFHYDILLDDDETMVYYISSFDVKCND